MPIEPRFTRRAARTLLLALCLSSSAACHRRRPPRNSEVEVFYEDPASAPTLTAALANPRRSKNSAAHDAHRHPVETLEFFGVRANSQVIELGPNDEYFTEILAPFLHNSGKLRIAWASGTSTSKKGKAGSASLPRYGDVSVSIFDPAAAKAIGKEKSADTILAINALDAWAQRGILKSALTAAAKTLRPGGILGIVQHRALAGEASKQSAQHGYLPEQTVIEAATAAGLQLSAKSELNANPYDKRDRPASMRSLSAAESGIALSSPDEAWIGESDRMTLRFVRTQP